MLPEPEFDILHLPVPTHQGIFISSVLSKTLSIEEIKELLISIDTTSGIETVGPVKLKYVCDLEQESVWLIQFTKDGDNQIGLVSGSEL